MQDLIAVGFAGKHRAAEVLAELEEIDAVGMIELADAVAVYRTDDGRLRVDQSMNPTTKEGAALGAVIGGLLGAVLAAPLTGGATAVGAAAAIGAGAVTLGSVGVVAGGLETEEWKTIYGVPDEFVKQVGGMVQPGTSAIFARIRREQDPVAVARRFEGYGGTVLHTRLPAAQAAQVQQAIAARR